MHERPVIFENEGQQLVGVLHEPADGGSRQGVVFCHGFTGNKMESHRIFVQTARALAEVGFYVLRFDFRGSGDSAGEFSDMTITGEVSDVKAAVNWLKGNTPVDPSQIALLGFSLGGAVAALTASEVGAAALILWSAVAEPVEVFARAVPYEQMLKRAKTAGFWPMGGWKVGLAFLEELSTIKPLDKVRQFHQPILILHGSADQVVPVENGNLYFQNAGAEDKELHIIEGADHIYNNWDWKESVIVQTIVWMQKKLK